MISDSENIYQGRQSPNIRLDLRKQTEWVAMGMYVALFLVGGLSFHVESCDPTEAWPVAGADGFVSESIREALSFYTMTLPQ